MSALFLGLMSGTSMDAVDSVLADLGGSSPRTVAAAQLPLPTPLKHLLLELCHGDRLRFDELARADVEVARLFAAAAQETLKQAGVQKSQVIAIGSHGQTVFHQPSGATPTSMQLGDPNVIAEHTGITTVADFRRRDIAAGGQGAPLVPAFHHAAFSARGLPRTILNLGGMANLTVLPADPALAITGFDTGPGNVLMDAWSAAQRGVPIDEDGAWAAGGNVSEPLLAALLDDPYFAAPPPKSTGRELFNLAWLSRRIDATLGAREPKSYAADVQATLCALTVKSIALAVRQWAPATAEVIVCGGGTRNRFLMSQLARELALPVQSTSALGIDPQHVEALAFAWLAQRTLAHKSGNLPAVTGARHAVILGGIYPGGPG